MQTKLRATYPFVVACLLSFSSTFASSQPEEKPIAHYVGVASWYGIQHQGRKMANGHRFDRAKLTAASWYFPLGTRLQVIDLDNGKAVQVTITDRGPNTRLHRVLDLSEAAAKRLDYIGQGLTQVFLSPVAAAQGVVLTGTRNQAPGTEASPGAKSTVLSAQIALP